MGKEVLIDRFSFVVAIITLIFGLILFFSQTGEFIGSLSAALLAAGLAWVSYIFLRWLVLALHR